MSADAGSRTDAQSVYLALRGEIGTGVLGPRDALRKTALAARFGVSRTPVREALRRLEQDRLVVPAARGMEVRAVEPDEVVHVYDMRVLLEGEAAGQAAQARRTADLLALEGLLARDRALVEPDDATRTRTNLEFHAALWRAAHNPVLVDLLDRLTVHLVHTPHSTLSVGDRWSVSLDEHAAMVEAVRSGDEPTARTLARDHMDAARTIRLSLLRQAAPTP